MAKCFITGVELVVTKSYVIDIPAAHRALRDMRQRTATLERLIKQLSPLDDIDIYDVRVHAHVKKKFRRLVSAQVATALSDACPDKAIFISWNDWLVKRKEIMRKYRQASRIKKTTNNANQEPVAAGTCKASTEHQEESHGTHS